MSLTKLLKAPIKLFRKEVITFLIIRRYDLGGTGGATEKLRYIAVKPTASISVLRQKVWHLLDLPDFCEEIIVLKSTDDVVLPLSELRRGNDPQHPYVLEVWLPEKRMQNTMGSAASTVIPNNMLTMGNGDENTQFDGRVQSTNTIFEANNQEITDNCGVNGFSRSTLSNETMGFLRVPESKTHKNTLLSDFKRSDLSCRISSTSLLKVNGRKSRDNFCNILFQIQSDLSTLSNKLSVLENKLLK